MTLLKLMDQHIYGGKFFRPSPHLSVTPSQAAVLTLWGAQDFGADALLEDLPEDPKEGLLRVHSALKGQEPAAAAEALLLNKEGDLLKWAACGQPSLFLVHGERTLALYQPVDANFDSAPSPQAQPLPSSLLGELEPVFSQGELKIQEGMSIVLISRSWVPAEALPVVSNKDQCIAALAKDSEDMPFWWCHLLLDKN